MMVNENQNLLNMFEKYLKSRGYNYLPVQDPTTVLKLIKTRKPDIILVHISENYLKMVNIIKAISRRKPVLIKMALTFWLNSFLMTASIV